MSIEKLLAKRPFAAADGRLDAAELEGFRRLAKQLTGKGPAAELSGEVHEAFIVGSD